jgi:hypothetical protein
MRAMSLSLALLLAGCAAGPVFVDSNEDGQAVLINAAGEVERVPASALPLDAGEGDWIGDPPESLRPERLAALRHQLAHADDGRDLTLP